MLRDENSPTTLIALNSLGTKIVLDYHSHERNMNYTPVDEIP